MLCSLAFNNFGSNSLGTTFTLIALVVFLIVSLFLSKRRINKNRATNDVILVVLGVTILILGILYAAGSFSGFTPNYNSIFKGFIHTDKWIKIFLIVFVSELIRFVTVPDDEKNKVRNTIHYIVMLGVFLMADISITTKIYNYSSFTQLYEFIALIVVQSISKNIFLNYLVKENGIKPNLIYRLVMDLYIYFLPITPKLNVFIEAVVLLVTPYFVYMMLESITKRTKIGPAKRNRKENKVLTVIGTIVFGILVALVSREFTYAMIAIGSESMTGTVNKGDAVIYKAYNKEKDILEAGDILVFRKRDMIIVHRIVKKYMVYDETVYQTKGDANEKVDNWVVNEEDVIGVVKQKVPLIAWPSVKLNEWF